MQQFQLNLNHQWQNCKRYCNCKVL